MGVRLRVIVAQVVALLEMQEVVKISRVGLVVLALSVKMDAKGVAGGVDCNSCTGLTGGAEVGGVGGKGGVSCTGGSGRTAGQAGTNGTQSTNYPKILTNTVIDN